MISNLRTQRNLKRLEPEEAKMSLIQGEKVKMKKMELHLA
jgi:hypothetical protein